MPPFPTEATGAEGRQALLDADGCRTVDGVAGTLLRTADDRRTDRL
jgi:hypothetical protein